jgi:hypothetical protein
MSIISQVKLLKSNYKQYRITYEIKKSFKKLITENYHYEI